MKRYNARHLRWLSPIRIAAALTLLALAGWGCAHFPSQSAEKALRGRVLKVWNARGSGDCAVIYALACSNYRKNITKDQHMARPCKGHFQNFRLKGIEFSPDGTSAKATIRFDTQSKGILLQGVQIKEAWIKEKGEWVLELPIHAKTPFTP